MKSILFRMCRIRERLSYNFSEYAELLNAYFKNLPNIIVKIAPSVELFRMCRIRDRLLYKYLPMYLIKELQLYYSNYILE